MDKVNRGPFDSVFLSDVHLGWGKVSTEPFFKLLESIQTRSLYLVGDIFEWMYRRSGWINIEMVRFAKWVRNQIECGVSVTLISGNHDERLLGAAQEASWCDEWISGIRRSPYAVHNSRSGRKYLVVHGDLYDHIGVHPYTWKKSLAEFGYPIYLRLLQWFPKSNWLKLLRNMKQQDSDMQHHINAFRDVMIRLAGLHGCDGVICGHIHFPQRWIEGAIEYLNCGDWLEYRSFVAESQTGDEGFSLHYA